jgi:DNA-binding NarL/FixJ family response regulator
LTPRQNEVLRGIAGGSSVKTIARELRISPKTVECHRQNLMGRIGIHHVPGLVRYALQTGILPASWLSEQD